MLSHILIYVGASLSIFWGVAHLFPTVNVVHGFGPITTDNRRILTMEWINEGATLIFIGSLVIGANYLSDRSDLIIQWVNILSFIMLAILALISLFTGARVNYLPFKLCPLIFTLAGLLILAGTILGS